MKMDTEIHWMFESKGQPDAEEIGNGPPKAMMTALIHWLVKSTLYRRMIITVARTHEELWDRRQLKAEQTIAEVDSDMAEIFAQVLSESGVE